MPRLWIPQSVIFAREFQVYASRESHLTAKTLSSGMGIWLFHYAGIAVRSTAWPAEKRFARQH